MTLSELRYIDEEDIGLLSGSCNAIKGQQFLSVCTNENWKETISRRVCKFLSMPDRAQFSIFNLLRLKNDDMDFFIAQCLIDFGHGSHHMAHSPEPYYNYQLIGYAQSNIDLGKTFIRPEKKTDNYQWLFRDDDIDMEGMEHFNKKYYLTSTSEKEVRQTFRVNFLRTLAKYDGILMYCRDKEVFVTFDNELEKHQSRIVEELFLSADWISTAIHLPE